MMREILFKAKRADNGDWVEGYMWSKRTIGYTSPVGNTDEIVIDPETVCQYTGLSDKNGEKIFDGDILKWDEKEWGSPFSEEVKWDYEQLDMREHDWPQFCEIIGNVHDKDKTT